MIQAVYTNLDDLAAQEIDRQSLKTDHRSCIYSFCVILLVQVRKTRFLIHQHKWGPANTELKEEEEEEEMKQPAHFIQLAGFNVLRHLLFKRSFDMNAFD